MSTPGQQVAQQAKTVRLPQRLPLAANYSSRNDTILQDARIVNGYVEQQVDGSYTVEKRPQLTEALTIGAGAIVACLGFYCYKQYMFYIGVIGGAANLYIISLDTFAILSTTAINASGDMYSFDPAPTSLTNSMLYLGNKAAGYLLPYTTIPPILTPITDANFPTNAGGQLCWGSAVLDGSLYVMGTNGLIYGSDLDDPTTWGTLDAIPANADVDKAVAIAKHLTYIVALKQWTTNFFYDAGNSPGSPLSPVPDSQVPYGCLAGETLQELDGNLIWMTTGEKVACQIGRLNNLSFSIVSTPQIDRLIQSGGSANEFFSWTFKIAGHRFYGLSNYIANYTIVYDLDQNFWYIWTDSTEVSIFPIGFSSDQTETFPSQYIMGAHPFNGAIFSVQPDYVSAIEAVYTAGGNVWSQATVPVDIYTPSYDAGTRRPKTLDGMFFNADKKAGSVLQARYNEDDYQTTKWSNFRTIDLSRKRPMLMDNGSFSRRAYHFRHNCPVPFRISSVDLQMDLGVG